MAKLTPSEAKKIFQTEFMRILNKTSMNTWAVEFRQEQLPFGTLAAVKWNYSSKWLMVWITTNMDVCKTKRDAKRAAKHEVGHALSAHFQYIIETPFVSRMEFVDAMETFAKDMENIL